MFLECFSLCVFLDINLMWSPIQESFDSTKMCLSTQIEKPTLSILAVWEDFVHAENLL